MSVEHKFKKLSGGLFPFVSIWFWRFCQVIATMTSISLIDSSVDLATLHFSLNSSPNKVESLNYSAAVFYTLVLKDR